MRHTTMWPFSGRCMGAAVLLAAALSLAGCERVQSKQTGPFPAQTQIQQPRAVAVLADLNRIPPPEDPAEIDSPPASEVFENVKVLGDISATEFSRLMQAFSTWIAPEEGCEYCHNANNLASDEKYPKIVARRMIEMTRRVNTDWKKHVSETGVTCWTCHRGQPVPSGDWFNAKGPVEAMSVLGYSTIGRNGPSKVAVGASLPTDPLARFLVDKDSESIRVQATTALRTNKEPASLHNTQHTYSLMMYMANSLGVNCTYCHNTRALASWAESTPQRVTAWYGIRLVRELNSDYLIPLTPTFPAYRLGEHGDAPKVGCATCHKGVYKPLNGVSPLPDYMALAGVGMVPAGTPSEPEPEPVPVAAAPKKR